MSGLAQSHRSVYRPEQSGRPLRVGFLSAFDPRDPNVLSGMPHSTWTALEAEGLELVDVSGRPPAPKGRDGSFLDAHPSLAPLWPAWRATRTRYDRWRARIGADKRVHREAIEASARAQRAVETAEVDVLFGLCISTLLYHLKPRRPLVYASDTTARLINDTYPAFTSYSARYREVCDEIEGAALRKCSHFLAASRATADSAIEDYGVDPDRVRVVELGAHVMAGDTPLDRSAPAPDRLELILVAADPRRKRLELCVEVAEELNRRGWKATLNYVGPRHRAAERSDAVRWHGRLRLSEPEDRERHKLLLNRSHWMLLPSLAEAYGIAPCEAAHFGRPSAVSDAGGLPTVVQHGRTGVVLPLNAPAGAYAEAILDHSADPKRYRRLSDAALERARDVLSWDAWARRTASVFQEAIERSAACRSPG